MRYKGQGHYFLVLGPLASKVLVCWKLEPTPIKKSDFFIFFVGGDVKNTEPSFLVVNDVEDFCVFPSSPAAPFQIYLENDKTIPKQGFGIALVQHGFSEPALLYAAKNAFFDLTLATLKLLVTEWSIETPCLTLPDTVAACVSFFIEKYTGEPPAVSELQSIISLRYTEESSIMKEIADEDALLEVLDPEDHKAIQDSTSNSLFVEHLHRFATYALQENFLTGPFQSRGEAVQGDQCFQEGSG